MGQEVQTGSGPQSIVADPFGGSAYNNFLETLDAEIKRLETKETAVKVEARQAYQTGRKTEAALEDADQTLKMFLANSFSSAFEDQNKIEVIKDFLVNGMGVKDQEQMVNILPRLLEHARLITEMKMSPLDKLFYLIMNEKSKLELKR